MSTSYVQDMVSVSGQAGIGRSKSVTSSGQNVSNNPFLQIFSNMVEAQYLQNDEDMIINGNILSAQELIAMLMSGSESLENVSFEQYANLSTNENSSVVNFSSEFSAQMLSSLLNTQTQSDTKSSFIDFLLSKGLTLENINQLNLGSTSTSSSTQNSDFSSFYSGESNFLKAVDLSKKVLSDTDSADYNTDLAAIISNLNSSTKSEAVTGIESFSENSMLLTQIENGVKENIKANISEFTLKLYPESLGEITVKIINEDGVKSLEIIAASAKTAMLINDEIPALKDALLGMQIEVKNAVEASSQSSSSNMQNFNFSSNDFTGRQWNFTQSDNQSQNFTQDEAQEDTQTKILDVAENELNIYV